MERYVWVLRIIVRVVGISGDFELENVSFKHHPNLPNVLDKVDTTIKAGSRTAILGANGAGKTTLFYSLTGAYKPTKGMISFCGEPVDYTKKGLTKLRSKVAIVLQNPDEQMFSFTVEEDVAFGPLNLGLDKEEVGKRIDQALKEVRMSYFRNFPLHQLSGGQRKRVTIAGALAVRPDVMIMDEPTAGLDPQASMEVMELVQKLHINGTTVIISTHDVDLAYGWADTVRVIVKGGIVYSGSSEGFYEDIDKVIGCGLLRPSTFNMNKELSFLKGTPESPYPRSVSEYISKFGADTCGNGRLFCVPYKNGDISECIVRAVAEAGQNARIGVYGVEARGAVTDVEARTDFYFDGIDSCLSEAVLGRDSVLLYDEVYEPYLKEKMDRLALFGSSIERQVIG